jgi:hypothetical protein
VTTCPVCRLQVTALAEPCPHCQASATDRDRLTSIAARRSEIYNARLVLMNEDAELVAEANELTQRIRTAHPASVKSDIAVGPSAPRVEVPRATEPARGDSRRTERVRDSLLWLGGGLLALSAISLAAVLWSNDQPAGEPLLTAPRLTVLLLVVTIAVAVVTRLIVRRLPATAEVTATLTLALAGLDWYVARRAGIGRDSMSLEAWLAMGAFVLAALAAAQRRLLGLRAPLVTAPALGLAGLGVAVLPLATGSTTLAVVAAACSAVCIASAGVALRTRAWPTAAVTLLGGAAVFEIIGIAGVLTTLSDITEDGVLQGDDGGLALATLALALPFFVALVLERERLARVAYATDIVKGCIAFTVIGSAGVALVVRLDVSPFLTAMAWLGGAVAAVGFARPRLGPGVAAIGASALCVGSIEVVARVANALFVPLSWWTEPWSLAMSAVARDHLSPVDPPVVEGWWWAVAAAAGVVTSGLLIGRLASRRLNQDVSLIARTVSVGVTLTAVVYLLPMAVAGAVWLVLIVQLTVAAGLVVLMSGLESRNPSRAVALGVTATVIAFGASSWALGTVFATVAFFITIAVIAALAGVRSSVPATRRVLAAVSSAAGVAAVACVVLGATRHLGPTGFATSCTGAALVLVVTLARRFRDSTVEGVGVASTAIGVAVAAGSPGWLAAAATAGALAVVGASISGGALFGNRPYRIALPIIIVLAADAWLAAAGVGVVEAYTVPLGAAFVIAGATARNWYPQLGSWGAYALGLLVALLPSLVLLLERGGSLRLIGLIAGGTVCVVVGAVHRLQAPMLLGAAVLVTIGIDALSPVAADLPSWIPLGTSGLVILWIGITFERRLDNVRHLRDQVRSLQ